MRISLTFQSLWQGYKECTSVSQKVKVLLKKAHLM